MKLFRNVKYLFIYYISLSTNILNFYTKRHRIGPLEGEY